MSTPRAILVGGALLGLAAFSGGCASPKTEEPASVASAWEEPPARVHVETLAPDKPAASSRLSATSPASGAVLAVVDGKTVTRDRLVDLLLRGHGVRVLQEIIVLDAAKRESAARGLTVTDADLAAEYDNALRRLLSPLPTEADTPLDRAAGESVLERLLTSRNISRDEYMLGLRRNAHLRKIVEHEMQFSGSQLQTEYERAYGARVKVRHIQLATFAEAERILQRLQDPAADFAALARDYSANPNTAPAGGLLSVFSRSDEDVPQLMRDTAFALATGEHSGVIRVDEWYHILKVEEQYPPRDTPFQQAQADLERRLRRRLTEPAMRQLQETFLLQAQIELVDPILAEEFERKHRHKPR